MFRFLLPLTLVSALAPVLVAADSQKATQSTPAGYSFTLFAPDGSIDSAGRDVASQEKVVLRYITFKDSKTPTYDVDKSYEITPQIWQNKFRDGSRLSYLQKFFFANTRSKSNRGLRHTACFEGNARSALLAFFEPGNANHTIRDIEVVRASYSRDGLAIGLELEGKLTEERTGSFHFRMRHCKHAGKNSQFIVGKNRKTASQPESSLEEDLKNLAQPLPLQEVVQETDWIAQGFEILDRISQHASLPMFSLKSDYDRAQAAGDKGKLPWAGMDLRDPKSAEAFAIVVQNYFYEGMVDSPQADKQFDAAANKKRYWCHMPWLQVGETGREAIHGLTNERPIEASPIYPNATPGSNWGVAYYNAAGCRTIGKVFGTPGAPHNPPRFTAASGTQGFDEGTVSAKILFTTADFPDLQGAYTWQANVSPPNSTARSIQPVRHIQMDIAVKDSSLRGVRKELGNWVMTTYYYDRSYDIRKRAKELGVKIASNIPEGLARMRPVGSQVGFDKPVNGLGDSIIFAGSKTNQKEGRLNGPADNPKSSCLSCHGTAGTTVRMTPGFMKNESFRDEYARAGLDFSQQLSLAKQNFETRPRGGN